MTNGTTNDEQDIEMVSVIERNSWPPKIICLLQNVLLRGARFVWEFSSLFDANDFDMPFCNLILSNRAHIDLFG